MERQATANNVSPRLVSFATWLKQIGRSDTTGWRWAKAGWLHPVNIAGRPYLTEDDIQQFQTRAMAGEFSQAPPGAAGNSYKAGKEDRGVSERGLEPLAGKLHTSSQNPPHDPPFQSKRRSRLVEQ